MKSFIVRSKYTGIEGSDIEAFDHEDAAEKYAEWSDQQGDYSIIQGNDEVLEIESPDSVIKKFRVYGEVQNVYYAREES